MKTESVTKNIPRFHLSQEKVDFDPRLKNEQPIHWTRAFVTGALGSALLMGFVDLFYIYGATSFSLEKYVGAAIRGVPYGTHNWTVGFLANLIMGGIFGIFYGYCFEYVFGRAKTREGIWLGFAHAVLAGIAFFPFFGIVNEYINPDLYPQFGFLGSALGSDTFVILLLGHLLFGATVGALYGPVRIDRIRMRNMEPGEYGQPGELDVTRSDQDPVDRVAV